ncbi:PREDICTED: TMV resistance [Prunus dulcis]|uniref:PREDICTED: TMV resistance n=1 Tax=Prunus dulcis TaxID=3755 RepID=A0A5E4GIR2_PRUDU|nr:PREDICTED: TMV resistance [Prunus dulcis]
MHDLLEKMGKNIIEQESPTKSGRRSRLRFHKDVEYVLTNNKGTDKITGIMLNFPQKSYEIFLNVGRSFSKMKNLKILMNYNVCGDPSYIPNNLRVLDWKRRASRSWPANFSPKALVFNLPYSCIKQIGDGLQYLKKLTSLNFKRSQFLTEILDLSSRPDIRYLNANGCTSLVEVHPSVGYLDKLDGLDFCYCCELAKFPNKVRLKSLEFFLLNGCIKLESFSKIVDKMESLIELDLGRTAIKELPASIGHMIGLEILRLSESAIKELPASIGNLIGLKELSLSESAIKELPASIEHLTALEKLNFTRTAIQKLPSSFGNFNALKELWLSGTAIEELSSSSGNLTGLKGLNLQGCENLANLPQSIYGLQNLGITSFGGSNQCKQSHDGDFERPGVMYFEECNASNIDSLENFCCWSNLTIINLSKSDFVSLLVCISKCVNLWELNLRGCKRLEEILGKLPASIARIDMADCVSLERFSTLSKILENEDMQGISDMNLSNCHRLCDNLRLDVSKMAKVLLNQADLETF